MSGTNKYYQNIPLDGDAARTFLYCELLDKINLVYHSGKRRTITLKKTVEGFENIHFDEILQILDKYPESTLRLLLDEIASSNIAAFNDLETADVQLLNSIQPLLALDQKSVPIYRDLVKELYALQIKVILYRCGKLETVISVRPPTKEYKEGLDLLRNITIALRDKLKVLNSLFEEKSKQYEYPELAASQQAAPQLPPQQYQAPQPGEAIHGGGKYYSYKYMKYKAKYLNLKSMCL